MAEKEGKVVSRYHIVGAHSAGLGDLKATNTGLAFAGQEAEPQPRAGRA